MKVKFTRFEKFAGFFVMGALGLALSATLTMAIKQGLFESEIPFETTFSNADGVFPGSEVQISGLPVGSVDEVLFNPDGGVRVLFHVRDQYQNKVRGDSTVRAHRPFIIGNKILDLSPGSSSAEVAHPRSVLRSEATMDIMDLVGGRTLGPDLQMLSGLIENFREVAGAFSDSHRSKAIVEIFDSLGPLVKNLSMITGQVATVVRPLNKDHRLEQVAQGLIEVTSQMSEILPDVAKALRESPQLTREMMAMMKNLAVLTEAMTRVLPVLAEVAPELPKASRRAIEALDETVVVLKAMQRSFLLKGVVKEVRDEEAEHVNDRMPANKTDLEEKK